MYLCVFLLSCVLISKVFFISSIYYFVTILKIDAVMSVLCFNLA